MDLNKLICVIKGLVINNDLDMLKYIIYNKLNQLTRDELSKVVIELLKIEDYFSDEMNILKLIYYNKKIQNMGYYLTLFMKCNKYVKDIFNIDIEDKNGNTFLMFLINEGEYDSISHIKTLIFYRANINHKNIFNQSALILVIEKINNDNFVKYNKIINYLLMKKCDLYDIFYVYNIESTIAINNELQFKIKNIFEFTNEYKKFVDKSIIVKIIEYKDYKISNELFTNLINEFFLERQDDMENKKIVLIYLFIYLCMNGYVISLDKIFSLQKYDKNLNINGEIRKIINIIKPQKDFLLHEIIDNNLLISQNKIVRLLLYFGANPFLINHDGITPIQLCLKNKDWEIFKILLEKISIYQLYLPFDIYGNNLLMFCLVHGHHEALEILLNKIKNIDSENKIAESALIIKN